MAQPAYHPYQMPMVQNSSTEAGDKGDMPPPHCNGQQGSDNEWLEEWHQKLGGCYPAYRKANEAPLIWSTLPLCPKGIITTTVADGTQHQQTTPTLKVFWNFQEHRFYEYDPYR